MHLDFFQPVDVKAKPELRAIEEVEVRKRMRNSIFMAINWLTLLPMERLLTESEHNYGDTGFSLTF